MLVSHFQQQPSNEVAVSARKTAGGGSVVEWKHREGESLGGRPTLETKHLSIGLQLLI